MAPLARFDLAAPAAILAQPIFIAFRGPGAQGQPVSKIVQGGEPIFSNNLRRFFFCALANFWPMQTKASAASLGSYSAKPAKSLGIRASVREELQ
jgi:hypothetical protein